MALTAAAIINQARDLHPALSVQNAPVPIALRAISRYERAFVRDVTVRVPGFFAKQVVIPLPLAVFDAGIPLLPLIPAGWLDLTDAFFLYSLPPNPPRTKRGGFIPWEQRDMPYMWPAYTLRDDTLYFLGSSANYQQFVQFILTYTPLPAPLTTEQSVTILPDDAIDAYAALLAGTWMTRMVGNPAFDIDGSTAQVFLDNGAKERADMLTRIFKITQRQHYRVRDAGSGGGY